MICKNCGFDNADSAVFCSACGSRLSNDENRSNGFHSGYSYGNGDYSSNENQNYNRGYGENYSQNFSNGYNNNHNAPIDVSGLKKGSIIAVGIIALLTGNIIPLVLAILAYVSCNDYESAVRSGNYDLANRKFQSIARMRKWAWGLEIAYIVICIIAVILGVFVFGWMAIPYLESFAYDVHHGRYFDVALLFIS